MSYNRGTCSNLSDIIVQAPEYRDNRIHTGWLDSRIAMRVRVERPAWHISVVGGALYVSHPPFSTDVIAILKG